MTPVTVDLDKKRTLRYGLNAMVALEERGVSLTKASDLAKPRTFRAVLWAGLIHEDPSLTEEQVGAMVEDLSDLPRLAEAVAQAFMQSQPDAPKGKARPRKAQR